MARDDEDEWDDWDEEPDEGSDARWTPISGELRRGIALGFLAMLPLIVAYEVGVAHAGGARNAAEIVLFRPLAPLGAWADPARWLLLGAAALWALVHCARRHWALGPALLRVVLEGAFAAVLVGPLLVGALALLEGYLPSLALRAPEFAPDLSTVALACGGAAYEELLFRVGLYSALYVLSLRVARFLGLVTGARVVAESVALLGSAALFAAAHLALVLDLVGGGGEEFQAAVFTWRAAAGILLGLVFRLRGPGVAAWTHALFNLALLVGGGPRTLL